jgi:hypothetical protein
VPTPAEAEIDISNDDFETRFRYEKRTAKIFERLHSLVRAGYVPDFSSDDDQAFWLRHPSRKFEHNCFVLLPSGLVIPMKDRAEEFRFDLEDEAKFKKFLRRVPKPTWWDRRREKWLMILTTVVLFSGLLIFGTVFGTVVEWILKSVGGRFGAL